MDLADFAIAGAVLFLGALTQGFFGFGFGMIAMSGLTLTHDLVHASGVVNLTGLALTGTMAFRQRRIVLWGTLARIVPGIMVGVVIGVTALSSLDRTLMVRLLGVTIVGIAIWNMASPALREHDTPVWDVGMGLLGGTLGGAFNTGGPPLVAHLYRRADAPEVLRATVQASFMAIGAMRLPVATSQGLFSAAIWRDAALAVPIVIAAVFVGAALARRVPPDRFRVACWVLFCVLGAALVVGA